MFMTFILTSMLGTTAQKRMKMALTRTCCLSPLKKRIPAGCPPVTAAGGFYDPLDRAARMEAAFLYFLFYPPKLSFTRLKKPLSPSSEIFMPLAWANSRKIFF